MIHLKYNLIKLIMVCLRMHFVYLNLLNYQWLHLDRRQFGKGFSCENTLHNCLHFCLFRYVWFIILRKVFQHSFLLKEVFLIQTDYVADLISNLLFSFNLFFLYWLQPTLSVTCAHNFWDFQMPIFFNQMFGRSPNRW